jgi:hypothetical protein
VPFQEFRARYRSAVEPSDLSLPRSRVIAVPLALLAAVFVVLVAFGVTGSSTGILHQYFSDGADDRVIAGGPQPIRSDEWLVQTAWTISQVQQGLPIENQTLPGGWDATVQNDLPTRDWSMAFKPHLWGFLFLPFDQALAFKWWLPGFALIAAVFLFTVTLLPRRPSASLAVGASTFFIPFMQWWYLPITFWPPVLAFLIMTAVWWSIRAASRRSRIVLAVITGYVAVTVGMSVYVPFIVASAFPALVFAVGALFERTSRAEPLALAAKLRALIPLAAAAVTALAVVVVWVLTRWDTIQGFLSTVYPGQRVVATGGATAGAWRSLFAAPFTVTLQGGSTLTAFGVNASEASTVPLIGLFLIVPLVWLAVRRWRAARLVDWVLVALVALLIVAVAFLAVPGWDAVAHLLFIDRVPVARLKLLFGILSIVLTVLMAYRIDQWRKDNPKSGGTLIPALIGAGLAALSIAGIWTSLALSGFEVNTGVYGTRFAVAATLVLSALTVLAVFAFAQGWTSAGAGALLLLSVLGTAQVNPLYRGAYDLNQTDLVHEMKRVQDESGDSGSTWVGVGGTPWPNAVLMQAGLPAFNGVQGAPSDEMWDLIDPDGAHEQEWNRLANIYWVPGEGEPDPRNPAPDQIMLTFDSCESFAQENVDFVLSDSELDQVCLTPIDTVDDGAVAFHLYEIATG